MKNQKTRCCFFFFFFFCFAISKRYQIEGTILLHSADHARVIQCIINLVRSGILRHPYNLIAVFHFDTSAVCSICDIFIFQLVCISGFLMGTSGPAGHTYFLLAAFVYFISFV